MGGGVGGGLTNHRIFYLWTKYETILGKILQKSYDVSFTVHQSTRQQINTSDDTACVAGTLTR